MKAIKISHVTAVFITIFTLIFVSIADAHAGRSNRGSGDRAETPSARTGSSKNDRHGDGGRALQSAEKRIAELENQINNGNLNRKEKDKIKQTIKNIRENAQKKAKGETHSTKGKGRR